MLSITQDVHDAQDARYINFLSFSSPPLGRAERLVVMVTFCIARAAGEQGLGSWVGFMAHFFSFPRYYAGLVPRDQSDALIDLNPRVCCAGQLC